MNIVTFNANMCASLPCTVLQDCFAHIMVQDLDSECSANTFVLPTALCQLPGIRCGQFLMNGVVELVRS